MPPTGVKVVLLWRAGPLLSGTTFDRLGALEAVGRFLPQLRDARTTTALAPSVTPTNASPPCYGNRSHGPGAGLARLGTILETLAVLTRLRGKDRSHVDLLEMAIRWEQVRAAWFSRQGNWDESEACVAREQRLDQRLEQARIDAEIAARQQVA